MNLLNVPVTLKSDETFVLRDNWIIVIKYSFKSSTGKYLINRLINRKIYQEDYLKPGQMNNGREARL